MLDRLAFVFGEAAIALRRNGFMTFAAISTVAVSLFLLGGLAYVFIRTEEYAKSIPGKFEMRVFLKNGVTFDQVRQTAADIRGLPGVDKAFWIPRDKAWDREKQEHPDLTEGIENPFPDALKVTLRDLSKGEAVAAAISAMPTVVPQEGVQYLSREQRLIDQLMQVLRWIGSTLGGLMFVVAGILIYNAIRLTVVSRRLEIRVMQLVGASRGVMRVPFLIEGTVQGAIGGAFAAAMLLAAQTVLQSFLATLDPNLRLAPFPTSLWVLALGAVGGGYGLLCSQIAVQAPLKYR